ncbi:MAG: hypothetical protein SGARI_000223 [Bacillariaceae sp.]
MNKEAMNSSNNPTMKKAAAAATTAAEDKIALVSNGSLSDAAATDNVDGEKVTADGKRFLPSYKKPDAALTFPEKVSLDDVEDHLVVDDACNMMSLRKYATKEGDPETYCVAWLDDGKSFIVRNPDEFTRKVLPKFFKATKFSSFTRKLYRWGFRQVNRGIGPDDPIIFGNEHFQRDSAELMAKMRSTTAASTRKQEEDNLQKMLAQKRALDTMELERQQKRMLFNTLMQQNAMQLNLGALQPNAIGSSDQSNGLNQNALLMQSLQQNGQMFGSNQAVHNMQFMNAFGNNLSMSQSNNNMSNNNQSGSGNNRNGNVTNNIGNNAMNGLKPFDILAAQQQQMNASNHGNTTNVGNFNPLLNFQLPSSNTGLVMNNASSIMNGSMNNNSMGMSNNGGNMGGGGSSNNTNNPSTTAEIVNAAIQAMKSTP